MAIKGIPFRCAAPCLLTLGRARAVNEDPTNREEASSSVDKGRSSSQLVIYKAEGIRRRPPQSPNNRKKGIAA
jgi:hypothetical protein